MTKNAVVLILAAAGLALPASGLAPIRQAAPCAPDNAGIWLPAGFCATLFAEVGPNARHLVVAPNGVVYVSIRNRGNDRGRVVALRDTTGDGRADARAQFGPNGGTGLRIHDGYLYFAPDDGVLRWRLPAGNALVPSGPPDTVVFGLPSDRSHTAKTLAFDDRGGLYVNIGSPSNVCQPGSQSVEARGEDPCPELQARAGIWRFDTNRLRQRQADGERWATGIRNAVALGRNPNDGAVYAVSHGRDRLDTNWPKLYSARDNAKKPAEELFRLERGTDGGWPYCFYDLDWERKVLAPEYGGDGQTQGRCAQKAQPLVAFPAHWAPNDLLFLPAGAAAPAGQALPPEYQGGALVAFHGSWNRAPLPQEGFRVVFAPVRDGRFTGRYFTFADGFAAPGADRENAAARPMGLALGPDGALYISDSQRGRIWRVAHVGQQPGQRTTQAPRAPATPAAARPPQDATRPRAAQLPAGVTQAMVEEGRRLYPTICVACHGPEGRGGGAGPALNDARWLHVPGGDYAGIVRVIAEGVLNPIESPTLMPPKGGGSFTDAQVRALAAYVYSLSHPPAAR